ncbi:MAG: carboxylesterase family protein [Bryobacteraceae bacterium]
MNHVAGPLLAMFAISAAGAPIFDPVVVTQTGPVMGAPGKNGTVRVYKGIPYAAPPVGALRWKEPQPVAPWKAVRAATEFGQSCPQALYGETSPYYQPAFPRGEDCLYLNVWTAAVSASEKRPVMVWIHGGGYTRGSGATPTYNGELLASKGAVVVTINYRLGALGFFAHPELTKESPHHASGNYGLLDAVAALQWVQKNIAKFGGDPKRVTIFGESAGSSAVNFLVASPLAKGLIHRAIGESGANFGRKVSLAEAEKAGAAAGDLAALRAKPVDEVLKTAGTRPCVDGYFLTDDVAAVFAAGKQNDVPTIAGYNEDESRALAPLPRNATGEGVREQLKTRYGKVFDEFTKLYPVGSDTAAFDAYYNSTRDAGMGLQMRTWVREQRKTGRSAAYLYYFTRTPPGKNSDILRAYHAAEIAYVFGNLSAARPWQDTDRKLSDAMSSYWMNFAATGNPNGKGLAKWPSFDAADDESMVFGDTIEVKKAVNKAGLDFFDRHSTPAAEASPRPSGRRER